jgi:23S rRNA pseudouridine1911/1915/1917 synthase
MSEQIQHSIKVPNELGNKRFDQIAAQLFPDYSRARLKTWIVDGNLTVDGEMRKPKEKLVGGEMLTIDVVMQAEGEWLPEKIDFPIVFEDEHILVINKPMNLVVHPAAGNHTGTLLNGLLYHCPELQNIPRAGIVHRLDKDTTGLMVVAKTLQAQNHLVEQLQSREMGREYEAVLQGTLTGGGTVKEPIARHMKDRTKMAVHPTGKEAITHYRILSQFPTHTHVRVKLETGRTHQIRVHMAHIQHPLVGDATYGGRVRLPKGVSHELREVLRDFPRQALHAKKLELHHPATNKLVSWEVDLPEDFEELLDELRYDAEHHGSADY